ncbi:MAG: Ni/Fe-hydrogenase, b-type cytochrome subunit [Dehalococcoidales bacterium]|nr:Ni/Fe-hydrogenase, b-type cytochrome subunit [Dehalococcoidales bacterium]
MTNTKSSTLRHPLSFRILHEVIIVSIILLIITGFYIHNPFVGGAGFLMSLTRGVHFFFAAVLVIAAVARIIAMFVGRDRDWRSFIPAWSDLKLLPRVLNYYAYMGKEPELKNKYNPLQMISYCFAFILIIFQIISGLALKYPDGAFSWFNYGWFNNEIEVRIAHFVVTWLFVIFMMIHVYLTIREKFSEIKEMHLLTGAEETKE